VARQLVRALLCAVAIVVVVAGTSATAQAKPAAWTLSSSVRDLSGTGIEPTGISCITDALCIAVDYNGRVYALSGTHSEEVASTGYLLFAVSCPAKNFCMAMGNDSSLEFLSRGTHLFQLSGGSDVGDVHWESVSCPTPQFCMAGGGVVTGPDVGSGVVARWNGLDWSTPTVTDPPRTEMATNAIASLSCVSPSFCVGADDNGRTFRWNGSRWSRAAPLNQPAIDDSFHVSCTSAKFCLALGLGTSDVFTWNGQTWKRRGAPDLPWGNGVLSCATPDFCVATDDGGRASAWNGRSWSSPHSVFRSKQSGFQAISCVGATCEAVMGEPKFVYLYDANHPPKLPVLCDEVTCPRTLT
jgi:hypothetical protein